MSSNPQPVPLTCDGVMHRLKDLVRDLGAIPHERLDDEDRLAQRKLIHWSLSYQQRVRAIRRTQAPGSVLVHKPEHITAALSEVDRFCDQLAALIAGGNAQVVH